MLQFDLNHQAEVMYAIHAFVDVCLNFDMTNEDFIFNLERLYCAFEAYKQEGIEYAASIRAFIAVTEHVDSQRGMLSVGKYLSGLSIGEIKALRRILHAHRGMIREEIKSFIRRKESNREALLEEFEGAIKGYYSVLVIRVDLSYSKDGMSDITVYDFYQHINRLRAVITDKNGCFDALVTYAIALEQGITKGFHAHLALVINRSEHQSDYKIAKGVIEKWNEITLGKGTGWNINATENKENYEKQGRLGIGDIRRTIPEQGNNALGAVAYLSDPDKYEQTLLVKPRGRKTFYKGDYQHHGRPIPDTEENRRIKEWNAQTALAKLAEEMWFKKL
ncbi:inovirus-type Gp2 protein [Acinetobacter sp. SWAC57]|uniref:inovirus-type Gp2 protein n=1 Tax=Acinetobacter sp. SWAC57 TaxID=2293834 RepID=UPI000E5AD1BB|nr:inovirus-type Gp2 protein [Acinetobacter sp. SWAC57]RGD89084.1 inovirus Gp2 family protein [Acinetobacter sp. SWAC57]